MCGRFTLTKPANILKEFFPLLDFGDVAPRYNIAPSQQVLAVRHLPQCARPEAASFRWGLVPHWADDLKIGYSLINARSEPANRPSGPPFASAAASSSPMASTSGKSSKAESSRITFGDVTASPSPSPACGSAGTKTRSLWNRVRF